MTPSSLARLLSQVRRALLASLAAVMVLMYAGAPAAEVDLPAQELGSVVAGTELESPQPELASPGPICSEYRAPVAYLPGRGCAGVPVGHRWLAAAPPLRPPRA
jgi:hypothetical protein